MAEFVKEIKQSTSEISSLNAVKAGILQSSYSALDDSTVTISFETNNPLT